MAVYAVKRDVPNPLKISYYATFYAYPYFHQNWNLFVPPPSINYKLIAYTTNGEIDIFKAILIKHRRNRFAGNEPIVLALSNSIHYFEKNTAVNNCNVANDENFKIVEHFTKNYLSVDNQNLLKLLLIVTEIKTNTIKYYYN